MGQFLFATDTRNRYIANSGTEGDWSLLSAAAVVVKGGYIKIRSHSLDGVNADAIRWIHGSADIENQRTTAVGPGCNALGMGADENSTEVDQLWLRTLKLSSDQNGRAVNIYGLTNNPVGGNVLYIESQGIYGAFVDNSNGTAGYIKALLILPAYGNGYTTTEDYLININAEASFYQMEIGDVVGDTASGTVIRSLATFLNGRFGRIESFSGTCIEVNSSTADTAITVQRGNGAATCADGILHINQVNIPIGTTIANVGTAFRDFTILSYTVATLPAGSSSWIIVTDASGGPTRCFFDGTDWIDIRTGAAVTD